MVKWRKDKKNIDFSKNTVRKSFEDSTIEMKLEKFETLVVGFGFDPSSGVSSDEEFSCFVVNEDD